MLCDLTSTVNLDILILKLILDSEIILSEINTIKETLYDHVKEFSFPRLAGTEGGKKAISLTMDTFNAMGYKEDDIKTQTFEFSDFYSTTLIKLVLVLNLTFHLILALFAFINFIVTFAILASMAVFFILIIKTTKHPERSGFWVEYFGEKRDATNVFVKIDSSELPTDKAGNIIISAHLDSKSQTFNTIWRIALYRSWLYSGILLGVFYVIFIIDIYTIIYIPQIILNIGFWTPTIIISVSNVFLMFLNTYNKSPGALDNASGMSIVFELSRYFIRNPLKNFNVYFLITDGEELGTIGSRVFVNEYEHNFEKDKVFQINFDMISVATFDKDKNRVEYFKSYGVIPRRLISPILAEYLERAGKEESIEIYGYHLSTGAHTDSVPFHQRGFNAVDINTKFASWWTHSSQDTPDKVDPDVLFDAFKIAKRTVLLLDEDFNKLCKSERIRCESE